MAADPTPLGWIGTGRMGTEMVSRLLARGRAVTLYNRTRAKADALVSRGAAVAARPSALGACRMVFVCVSSSVDLEAVLTGPEGLLSGPESPQLVVDFSTVSAEASATVRGQLRLRGVEFLAAPVSGNPKVARAGKLTVAASGPRAAFDLALPHLLDIAAAATYVGDGESARLVKLCHNLFLGVVAQALVEVTVLAEKGGVRRQDFLAYLNRSVMGSLFTGYKTPALVNADFTPTFTTHLLRKDFDLGMELARELEVSMPVAALVQQLVQSLVGMGYGEDDFAALLAMAAQGSGMELVSEAAQVSDGLES